MKDMNDLFPKVFGPAWSLSYDAVDRCYVLTTPGYAIWCDPSVPRNHPYVLERILEEPAALGTSREWIRYGCVLAVDMPVPCDVPRVMFQHFT